MLEDADCSFGAAIPSTLPWCSMRIRSFSFSALTTARGQLLLLVSALTVTACLSSDPVSSTIVGSLSKVSGDSQTVVHNVGLASPMVVKVLAQNGTAISGATVRWAMVAGDSGAVADSISTSDASGLASMMFTAGSVADSSVQVTATLDATQLTFTHKVTPSQATAIKLFQGDGAAGIAGAVVQLTVQVTDNVGNAIPGVTVAWAVGPKGGTLVPSNVVTSSTGLSRAALTLDAGAGTYTVVVSSPGLPPVTFTVTQI